MKNTQTFYGAQTTSPLKTYSALHQIKASYFSGTKIFTQRFTGRSDICFPSASRMQFLSASGFGAAQMLFFLIPTRNIFAWESAKQGFWLCYGRIFFTMLSELSFVNEWGFLSETVLKNKWSFLLVFVGFETFLPENLKLINSEHEILDHLFSGPNFGSYSVT